MKWQSLHNGEVYLRLYFHGIRIEIILENFLGCVSKGGYEVNPFNVVSSPFLLNFCTTIPPLSSSDHQGFILSFHSNVAAKRPSFSTRRTVWCYNQVDFDRACELLDQTDWNSLCPKDSDVNQFWSAWQSRFCSIMEQCVTKKVLPVCNTCHGSTPTCYKQSRGEIPYTGLINAQALSTSSSNTDSSETPLYQPSVLPNMHISMTYIMWSPKPFGKRSNLYPSIMKVFLLSPVRVLTPIPMLGKLSS